MKNTFGHSSVNPCSPKNPTIHSNQRIALQVNVSWQDNDFSMTSRQVTIRPHPNQNIKKKIGMAIVKLTPQNDNIYLKMVLYNFNYLVKCKYFLWSFQNHTRVMHGITKHHTQWTHDVKLKNKKLGIKLQAYNEKPVFAIGR